MSLEHLPEITGALQIRRLEDRIEDGFGMVRTGTSPSVKVAVVHDGSDRDIGEAEQCARLLALAPVMLELLRTALGAWAEQFDAPDGADDADYYVSGADMVEWFAGWRLRVRERLDDRPPIV